MLLITAQIIGFAAVGLYLLSYQLKKRTQIIWVTFISNCLYVLQYVLLGAFSGATMDALTSVAAFFAAKKNEPCFQKHAKWVATLSVLVLTAAGLTIALLQQKWLELLPIGGAVLQTVGLWCNNEQTLRKFGLACTPFWLVYNFISQAYGAALGSLLVTFSIVVSLVRYRKSGKDSGC